MDPGTAEVSSSFGGTLVEGFSISFRTVEECLLVSERDVTGDTNEISFLLVTIVGCPDGTFSVVLMMTLQM